MGTRIRNKCCVPFVNKEGVFIKNIVPDEYYSKDIKCEDLAHPDRLHVHQTLASTRRFAGFKQFSDLIPQDQLDIALASKYNHTDHIFPEKAEVYIQSESLGIDTWRRLRNTRDLTPDRAQQQKVGEIHSRKKIPYKYNWAHKVLIGGLVKRIHPSYIKLMNTSHHSPQTNAGYSRQDSDGSPWKY